MLPELRRESAPHPDDRDRAVPHTRRGQIRQHPREPRATPCSANHRGRATCQHSGRFGAAGHGKCGEDFFESEHLKRRARSVVGRQGTRDARRVHIGRRCCATLLRPAPDHRRDVVRGDGARPEDDRRVAREVEDRRFDSDVAGPPSRIMLTCPPSSSRTCSAVVGLMRPKRFADGAAMPEPNARSKASATG